MRFVISLAVLASGVLASPQLERRTCNHDNCLRALIVSSAVVAPFCSTYTLATTSVALPTWASACSNLPSRISSGCSCINTATSTTAATSSLPFSSTMTSSSSPSSSSAAPSTTSTTIPSPSSSSSAPSTTSSAAPSTTSTSSSAPTTSLSSSSSLSLSSSSVSSSTSSAPPWVRTSAPAGAIIVDGADPFTPGSFPTVQEGVNALSPSTTTPQVLFIYPGTYVEQVYIPALKSNLTVQGWTLDTRSYEGNVATITFNLALLNVSNDDETATVRQWNPNTKFYNLNIANTFGHVSTNGQNLALSAHTTNQGYYGVQLWGYQDTLLANTGNQLYAKSLIVGAIDFIFGQTATAWLDKIDIKTIATGCVTASGRASATNPSWYVINNSTVDGINSTIPAGDNFLGRPWQPFARVVFQYTYLGDVIAPAGWRVWSTSVGGATNIQNVTFGEFANYGPGSILEEGPRANFSEQLASPVTIDSILGAAYEDEWWVDLSYLD